MAGKVSSEFKESFGRLLILLSTNTTIEGALKYSENLINLTKSGLITEDRYDDEYKAIFNKARESYLKALQCYQIQGRAGYQKEQILKYCFEINFYILPVALSEGILVLNQDSFNLTSMFNSSSDKMEK